MESEADIPMSETVEWQIKVCDSAIQKLRRADRWRLRRRNTAAIRSIQNTRSRILTAQSGRSVVDNQ